MSARIVWSISSLALSLVVSGCASSSSVEVPIAIPSTPALDVSAFQRVLVAGFVVGGTTEIDTNEETVRLLRSQLRSKSSLKVIDSADVLPLTDVARLELRVAAVQPARHITSSDDLRAYEPVFANAAYWKRLGEEYQNPIIVTGTMFFTIENETLWAGRNREEPDPYGPRRRQGSPDDPVLAKRTPRGDPVLGEYTSCTLRSRFIFIDGRTGAPLYSAVFHEAVSYDAAKSVPALSGYFELMDRVLPEFLNVVSMQTFRASRNLLQ